MLFSLIATVGFLLSHPNPCEHAQEFIQAYEKTGEECRIYTDNDAAAKRFNNNVEIIPIENEDDLEKAARLLEKHDKIIVDISIPQWKAILEKVGTGTKKIAYYDNPERFVSPSYSQLAEEIIDRCDTVLFSNKHHASLGVLNHRKQRIDLSNKEVIGLGFYPQKIAEGMLNTTPEEKLAIRASLLSSHSIEDTGQKILVIAGGANEEYYKAFFRFMLYVRYLVWEKDNPFENTILVLQQHPRSIQLEDKDGNCFKTAEMINKYNPSHKVHFMISNLPTAQALAIADTIVYQQTSMAPQFILGNAKKVFQIADKEPNNDILLSVGVPWVATEAALKEVLKKNAPPTSYKNLTNKLGMDPNWKANLPK